MNPDFKTAVNLAKRSMRIKELNVDPKVRKSLEKHEINRLKAAMVSQKLIKIGKGLSR